MFNRKNYKREDDRDQPSEGEMLDDFHLLEVKRKLRSRLVVDNIQKKGLVE